MTWKKIMEDITLCMFLDLMTKLNYIYEYFLISENEPV